MSLREIPKGTLRDGFTTGTCATASAKSGLMAIIHQKKNATVKVHLPIDKIIEIPIHHCEFTQNTAKCSVIKDAGDDPDVTNGAEIGCILKLTKQKGIQFFAGDGVGTVTLKGLELAIGEPAINPVPRKMISSAIQKLLHEYDLECGVSVTVYVTDGKKLAKRTLNERVGIMNGISILGTTGIVKPYSSSSYIASIEQGIDVAIANNITELVINSGARSEKFLSDKFSHLPEYAFIHYGNWIGETLAKVNQCAIQKVSIGIMLGKAVKLAGGITDTHSCVSSWNKDFVVELAQQIGFYDADKIKELNMAGRLIELFEFEQNSPFFQLLLAHCYKHTHTKIKKVDLNIYLIHKDGTLIKYIKNTLKNDNSIFS
ncbi:cobalt-precorrin-5B (C(1))-methyltransferase CbiD [Tenacibaculum finnmarkense]|uniref:cobalt-precorrin-5B (C(1))-methyltransferase CbiD n=1 Tax=Tenacibaculum finnmarkense TaxID=2781243 RepID=UPI001EFA3D48|nr:cobalt-precorrin-5B (C(1))-methyltransferase CbiD [Tenacibaculum finnmarkense]MCG8754063.1 cobalt-precorrin-5B (C(1))-methyltransferase [Tenacibaculum finnmarkense]MCG8782750.1 cobalt-precorrin-5B (C(1))-methyltransferase [Tenacibaculum finnmarkense]